jgi:hypothetical protein
MTTVLHIEDLRFVSDDFLQVEAVVDDMVLTRRASREEPEEWGPALCRGTMYFCEDDRVPASEDAMKTLLSERVNDWSLVDWSDCDE